MLDEIEMQKHVNDYVSIYGLHCKNVIRDALTWFHSKQWKHSDEEETEFIRYILKVTRKI